MENKIKPLIIAGPCVVESKELLYETASELKNICSKFGLEFVFKSSYKKANRTSKDSFTGIGDQKALEYLLDIRDDLGIQVLTDIHSADEADLASKFVDVLQIPAFLSRQTDIIQRAANTGLIVNIKKGQFMSPENMKNAIDKAYETGNDKIWITERGTFFGYHDLVVDFRSLVIMKKFGCPVIFDATHSVQRPSLGFESGGTPEFIPALSRAAAAVGVDGLFFETHPDPSSAKSDSKTQLKLEFAEKFIKDFLLIFNSSISISDKFE